MDSLTPSVYSLRRSSTLSYVSGAPSSQYSCSRCVVAVDLIDDAKEIEMTNISVFWTSTSVSTNSTTEKQRHDTRVNDTFLFFIQLMGKIINSSRKQYWAHRLSNTAPQSALDWQNTTSPLSHTITVHEGVRTNQCQRDSRLVSSPLIPLTMSWWGQAWCPFCPSIWPQGPVPPCCRPPVCTPFLRCPHVPVSVRITNLYISNHI